MKKIAIALAVGALSIAANAQTNQVLSRNAVGYVKVDVRSNGLTMVRMPFFTMPATNLTGIMGGALFGANSPGAADQVQRWVATNQTYQRYYKRLDQKWYKTPGPLVETTDTILPGESFWINSKQLTNQTVYLMGEVPDKFTLPTFTTNHLPGLNMTAYAYPVEIAISNMIPISVAYATNSPGAADQVITWNLASQTYNRYYAHPTGWRKTPGPGVTTTDLLGPAAGIWYQRRVGVATWIQTKPYTWP